VLTKVAVSPPLWGLAAAVAIRLAHVAPPTVFLDSFDLASRSAGSLLLIALGLKFEPTFRRPKLLALSLVLRFGLGALVGAVFVRAMALKGLDARVAVFAATAPIGFNAITFAELEHLDTEFAASQVSVGLITAIALSPLTTQLIRG
jgi:predicted permease